MRKARKAEVDILLSKAMIAPATDAIDRAFVSLMAAFS
jgi:hypothetical protein